MAEPPAAAPPPPPRSEKRPPPHSAHEPVKRRAPYAPRACDACKRRKGRCDGRQPCEHCQTRPYECRYSAQQHLDRRNNTIAEPPESTISHQPAMGNKNTSWNPDTITSLCGMVATLQGQLDALAAQVKKSNESRCSDMVQGEAVAPPAKQLATPNTTPSMAMPVVGAKASPTGPPVANLSKRTAKRYYGPTSPDYSLNAARLKMQQGKASSRGDGGQKIPTIDDEQSDDEDSAVVMELETSTSFRQLGPLPSWLGLLQFRSLISKREALQLLGVYQEAIGELHPICDIGRLRDQVETLYDWPSTQQRAADGVDPFSDDISLLIVNLTLSIALCADSLSHSPVGRTLYNSCQDIINAKLVCPAISVEHVTMILLVGFYHYFMGKLPQAWRMCGIAGRLAMELGLHSKETAKHYLAQDQQQEDMVTISCTLIVLDRQWSAASGLPSNFQLSDFELATKSSVSTPYLKAMMAFTLMSCRFNEPISRVAQGGTYEDDDAFEVNNFQVEQWRKKAIEKHNFTHPSTWETTSSERPPSWTLLLYLRANAIRGILLRPFFLSQTITSATRRQIQPGLDLIADTVSALSILDKTTDVYRKQHPLFHHFLATSCALLFLIVVYTEQNRTTLGPDLPPSFTDSVRQSFLTALRLSAAYSSLSASSRRLWRRLISMREPLACLGILPRDKCDPDNTAPAGSVSDQFPIGHASRKADAPNGTPTKGQHNSMLPFGLDDNSSFDLSYAHGSYATTMDLGLSTMDGFADLSSFDSADLSWPCDDVGNFFSESGF